ncbi:hypothetical protein FGG08_005172 [Glutinoglossum americanum]|uniref:Major facilitator superfamily (MFS) profile domain-containing protein n=1 Tax=Glutinoglossum americanum TaxID=1670608 RepID=A0A9P8HUZ6_9PEZI|nr:hypothetical protein FGG08_005172 [Glutinoglossum americanum]
MRPVMDRRKSSTAHYQTFPTSPPSSRGRPPSQSTDCSSDEDDDGSSSRHNHHHHHHHQDGCPLPKKQLAILAIIVLAEQTALNSIPPYLPERVATFPEVRNTNEVGVSVGAIASSFALAQFATNSLWGSLSDRIGRKPVILLGTILTAGCFVAFAFVETLWQAIFVQVLMGLVGGNQGVVSACLGEVTGCGNQSRAFVYLPVIYGIGGIAGPIVGGLLVFKQTPFSGGKENLLPYLLPNVVSAAILLVDLILAALFLDETLEGAKDLPPLWERVGDWCSWLWRSVSSSWPSYLRLLQSGGGHRSDPYHSSHNSGNNAIQSGDSHTASQALMPLLFPRSTRDLSQEKALNRDTILLLTTYFILQLSNVSFNSLYPIFSSSPPPTGRSLSTGEIGLSLSFSGLIAVVFRVSVFGKLRDRIGNRRSYRAALAGFVLSFILIPWIGYKNSKPFSGSGGGNVGLWLQIGVVLVIKTIAAVGGLTSALLLLTNSAPSGLVQTLSGVGRIVGPFLSGGLFSLATRMKLKGEALAWCTFGAVALVGFAMTFGIRGEKLDADDWGEGRDRGEAEVIEGDEETQEGGRASEEGLSRNGKRR